MKSSMWLGYLVMIGMALVLAIFEPADGNATLAVLFCVSIFTANFFGYIGLEAPGKDERARKIGTMAATYSWFVTLCAVCFVYISDVALRLDMSIARFLGITLLVMVGSMMAFNEYHKRKGDVE